MEKEWVKVVRVEGSEGRMSRLDVDVDVGREEFGVVFEEESS